MICPSVKRFRRVNNEGKVLTSRSSRVRRKGARQQASRTTCASWLAPTRFERDGRQSLILRPVDECVSTCSVAQDAVTEGYEGERADPDKDAGTQFAVLVRLQPIG